MDAISNFKSFAHSVYFASVSNHVSQPNPKRTPLFYQEWVGVLLIIGIAAGLRFWQLGELPPGLYSDEAFNGLDALEILNGKHALFFAKNNGREPFYIYMSALAVRVFGRTALAVRLPAALLGTLTVFPTYLFSKAWFGRRTGLLTALLWATTVWPIHLSRVGFRSIGLPFFTAIFLYLATCAYQKMETQPVIPRWTLFAVGIGYACLFYTYLPARLTPIFLIVFLAFMLWQQHWRFRWDVAGWFCLGVFVGVLPFGVYALFNWALVFGRTGQVSILSPIINNGDLIATFWQHLTATIGMFLWQGDVIARHNPVGRPVFDMFIALPFLWGVIQMIRGWRRPPMMATLLWVGTLLWGTILAEDAPHFLRAVGILPVLLIFPADSLSRLSNWSKLPRSLSASIIAILLLGSSSLTIRDYFVEFKQQDEAYYLFESAARELAEQVNLDQTQQLNSLIDERFTQEWESVLFLTKSDMQTFAPARGVDASLTKATSLYAWPYESTNYLQQFIQPPMLIGIDTGSLARGDLETQPYVLYTRYVFYPNPPPPTIVANFDNQLHLHEIVLDAPETMSHLTIRLTWSYPTPLARELKAFVHVLDRTTMHLVGQADAPAGGQDWRADWWELDVRVQEKREISLGTRYDPDTHVVMVGVYDPITLTRLSILDEAGQSVGDSWEVKQTK